MPQIDVAELNLLLDIVKRLQNSNLQWTAEKLRAIIHQDLYPLSSLATSVAAQFGAVQAPLEATCSVEGCNVVLPLYNVSRKFSSPQWLCSKHLPADTIQAGFPHPKYKDDRIVDAWRAYFKREAAETEAKAAAIQKQSQAPSAGTTAAASLGDQVDTGGGTSKGPTAS